MQKEAPALSLMLVDLGAKPDVAFGLFHAKLELLKPRAIVPVHVLVQFLQS